MKREIVDALLTGMLESGDGVSDLLFVAGKPPLVETHGRLQDFPIDTAVMTSPMIEAMASEIMNGQRAARGRSREIRLVRLQLRDRKRGAFPRQHLQAERPLRDRDAETSDDNPDAR
jgi:Tfp pilus assembly ATPase PilU